MENWLDCWPQKVVISSAKSNWQVVTTGVPQVLIMGAILFNTLINNLNDRIESILRKPVDKTMLQGAVNILQQTKYWRAGLLLS